ncbi:Eukaryotic translation initiation factor-like protein [Quillaja saponaria]|uniref:Eukaryotic translation initiation factor-like protein n=1 Tax=Quillaja saponaria TaxID=32244 RepID=A0AAD7P9Q1_QUISA|nr:Eukaryotic translation initiation factor-like protein [Quillaja saponaria]
MSKKKVSGNTMTLKDFHGGSIPTDLPLPSAPGVTLRASDRPCFDRSTSWGNPMVRSDHWSRPHTSPATRHFDDKTPFITHTAQIGRNFDEDERKPLDGVSAPRRTISDDSIQVPPTRVELKPDYELGGSSPGQQVAPVSQSSSRSANSYSGRLNEAAHMGMGSHNSREQGNGGVPNAWVTRKEIAAVVEPEQTLWAGPSAVSKLAHASAIDKVSSGRWQSKVLHYQTDAEVVRASEVEPGYQTNVNGNNRMATVSNKEYNDAILARHSERGLDINERVQGSRKELIDYERSEASKYIEPQQRNTAHHSGGVQQAHSHEKFSGSELEHSVPSEPSAWTKLKLQPSTKTLENLEPSVADYAQGYQWVSEPGLAESNNKVSGNMHFGKPGPDSSETEKLVAQRPKLNLKPRSQPLEQLEGSIERDRSVVNVLFGGARPRELVLKERRVDDVVTSNNDLVEFSNRVEHYVGRNEKVPDHSIPTKCGDKPENAPHDQRIGKKPERKEQRADVERGDMQRKNWRGENRRTNKETERQQLPERQPSPETWRKPIEQPKPASADAIGFRHGRAASAVELAQAFSRSVSDPKTPDRFPGQRAPGQKQIPFSRLVGPTSRPQINGY